MKTSVPIYLVLITFILACGSGEPSGGVERSEAGDTMVIFSPAPIHSDTILGQEVMRWGQFSGDPDLLFSEIYAFSVSSDGGIIVHDDGEGIREFDSQGRFVGRLAGTGAGPGEIRYLGALAQSKEGRVAAYDIGHDRISIYGHEGVTTLARPEGMPRYGGDGVLFTEDGSLWISVSPAFPAEGGVPHPRPIFARVEDDGTLRDTVFTPSRLTTACPVLSNRTYQRGFWEDVRAPFVPKMKWTMASDGSLLFGCPATYEFEVVRPDGAVYRMTRAWEPLRISDDHRDHLAARVGIGNLPEERPAYARLEAFNDGRIWVRPTLPSQQVPLADEVVQQFGITHTWGESARAVFDVFTAEDGWLGTVALPPEARYSGFPTEPHVVIRGDSIWAMATDSLDVQYIVKYVAEWPK